MTDAPAAPGHSSGLPRSGPACGNCGAAVAVTDVTCPACDALLAAYQAPEGTAPLDVAIQSISTPVPPSPQLLVADRPTSTNPATATSGPGARSSPPPHRPRQQSRTMSPIGDALDRIEERGSSIGADAEIPSSDDVAAELSKMADNDSELARDVDARLRGAKVRFDGASPTIEAQPEPPTSTPSRPATPVTTVPTRDPVRPVTTHDAFREAVLVESAAPADRRRHPYAGKVARAIPFVLIVLFLVVGFDRTVSIISGGIIIGVGVLIVAGLIAATSRVGRKTTSMIRDDSR